MMDKVVKERYRSNEYLLRQNYVFESNMEVIAKHFLKDYFRIEGIFKLSFEEILTEFNRINPVNDVKSATEGEFFKEICKNYIGLEYEPRQKYFNYINRAMDNLQEIEENLNYCNYEIERLINNENKDQYHIRKMNYFIQINQEQKDAIVKFLVHDIKRRSLNDSRVNSRLFTSIFDYPYNFSMIPNTYNPKTPHNVEVKFGNLSIQDSRDIMSLYENDKDKYYNFIQEYISDNDICAKILDRIKNQYYLMNRTSILESAINSYNKGDLLVFINLAAIQIEGLFHEYCKTIGIEVENKEYTLVEKIERIKSKGFLYGYEYFAFDFPKLRNKVAHGRLIQSSDIVNISNELILDLNYLTGIFDDIKLPINTLVHTLNNFTNQNPNTGEIVDYLIDGAENLILFNYLFESSHDELLDFYALKEKRECIKNYLIKDDVWNELIKMIDQYNSFYYDDDFNKKVETIKRTFIKSEPHKQQSIKLNKKLSEIKHKYNII